MPRTRNAERKPLSFSTTMRNPERIGAHLSVLTPYEGKILNNEIIINIIKDLFQNKIIFSYYELSVPKYKKIFLSDNLSFSTEDLNDLIENSADGLNKRHKEFGFDKGWPSRFATRYGLPQELGFVRYEIGQPIKISQTGHMLINAYNNENRNEELAQNVMLNALMKYQTNNPFRKNLNSNAPLPLLLNVLNLLKQDKSENGAGIYKLELPILICWGNNDAYELYKYIKTLREEVGYSYSIEFIYEKCLELLGADDSKRNRFKMDQICGEAIDEYIRKMRSTGIISLRGNGRFIDFNMVEEDKINYIIKVYSEYPTFEDKQSYYDYIGEIDSKILEIKQSSKINLHDIKIKTLYKYAQNYSEEEIFNELMKVCNRKDSKDEILKFINAPTRLEFLTSIALVQQFKEISVEPNYSVDDEGLPTFTAGGNIADIECYDSEYNSLFEVTLMCGRQDQVHNEIIPISRHLAEQKVKNEKSFSVFIAPVIHPDTKKSAAWIKFNENLDIIPLDINEFIESIQQKQKVEELLLA